MAKEPSLRDFVRGFIGMTALDGRLNRMEKDMATAKEQIAAVSAQVDDLAADVRARNANLDPEAAAELSALAEKVRALDTEVGDADGSDNPPPAPVDEPVDGQV